MAVIVTGEVELPSSAEAFSGASLFISLESVGLMDMPAQVIVETVQRRIDADDAPFSFSLDGDIGDSSGPFNVRAHISMDGSGDVRKGDYLTKRNYTVLKENNPDYVIVKVEKV